MREHYEEGQIRRICPFFVSVRWLFVPPEPVFRKDVKIRKFDNPVSAQIFDGNLLRHPVRREHSKIRKIHHPTDIQIGYVSVHACLFRPPISPYIYAFSVRPRLAAPIRIGVSRVNTGTCVGVAHPILDAWLPSTISTLQMEIPRIGVTV